MTRKVKAPEVLQKVRHKREQEKRESYTFRLPKGVMKDFKDKCGLESVSMTEVLMTMIEDFTYEK